VSVCAGKVPHRHVQQFGTLGTDSLEIPKGLKNQIKATSWMFTEEDWSKILALVSQRTTWAEPWYMIRVP